MTAIIGWAHSKFGKLEAETLESLIAGIAAQAIADAGIEPKDVDTIYVGNFGGFEKQSFPAAFALAADHRICVSSRRPASRTPAPPVRPPFTLPTPRSRPTRRASCWWWGQKR